MKRCAVHFSVMLVLVMSACAMAGPPPSEADMKLWIRGVYSDDSAERITSTVELTKHAEHAKAALPHLEACLDREEEPGIRDLMRDAIRRIKAADGQAIGKPTDTRAAAARLAEVVEQLRDNDPAAKRRAATALRLMGVFAYPVLGELRSVAESHADKLTARTAATAVKMIEAQLWFQSEAPPKKAGDAGEMKRQLDDLVGRLVAKLDDAKSLNRIRAIRSLATMEAAAAPALDRLHKIALEDDSSAARRLAGVAIRRITVARDETEAYYRATSDQRE